MTREDKFVPVGRTLNPEETAETVGAAREKEIIDQEYQHRLAERERNEETRQRYYWFRRCIEWTAFITVLMVSISLGLSFLFPEWFGSLAWERLINALFVVVGSAVGGWIGHFLWKLFSPYDR